MPEYLNITLRAIFAYFTLLILCKAMGKRQISQMNFFDYIVGITIGSLTANAILKTEVNILTLFAGLLVFVILQIIFSFLSLKSKKFRSFVEGKKTVLIEKGTLNESNMVKSRMNIDRIEALLRDKNVFKLSDVEYAIFETNGKISVMKKSNKQPVTPKDINLPVTDSGLGYLVIREGIVEDKILRKLGLTNAWLKQKLESQGIKDYKDVLFAQVDGSLNLYVDVYQENKNYQQEQNKK